MTSLIISHFSFLIPEGRYDEVKLLGVETFVAASLTVDEGTVHHFEEIVISQFVLSKFLCYDLHLVVSDFSCSFGVIKVENALDSILGFDVSHLGGNDIDELFHTDRSVLLSESHDKLKQERISLTDSKICKSLIDFLRINGSTSVLVIDFECFFELLVVSWGESFLP